MRKPQRLAALVAAAGAVLLLAAPPALAGGPTSVLLVAPATGRADALYVSSLDYIELSDALGTEPPVAAADSPDLHGGPGSSAINITWLMHDVQVWRIDHVFTNESTGQWVETYQSYDGNINFDQRGVVHRAAKPDVLARFLDARLGLAPPVTPTTPAPQPVSVPISQSAVAEPTGLHWGSLVVGLAIGAMVMAVARQLWSRRRA